MTFASLFSRIRTTSNSMLLSQSSNVDDRNPKNLPVCNSFSKEAKRVSVVSKKSYDLGEVNEEDAVLIEQYLRYQEKQRRLGPNFLKEVPLDGKMRTMLLDWLLSVSGRFDFSADTWMLATCIVDRTCCKIPTNNKNYQLMGLACLYIAAKYEEVVLPNINDFVYMGTRSTTVQGLLTMEVEVLKAIGFALNFTYPISFLRNFKVASNASPDLYNLSKFFADVAIIHYNTSHWLPSEIGVVSIFLSHWLLGAPFDEGLLTMANLSSEMLEQQSCYLAKALLRLSCAKGTGLHVKYKNTRVFFNLRSKMTLLEELAQGYCGRHQLHSTTNY